MFLCGVCECLYACIIRYLYGDCIEDAMAYEEGIKDHDSKGIVFTLKECFFGRILKILSKTIIIIASLIIGTG